MVLRRLVEEVFLLRSSDLGGEPSDGLEVSFHPTGTQNLLHDPLPYVRTQTISLVFTALRDKPEQEQNLLRLLVNKLVRVKFDISLMCLIVFHRATLRNRFLLVFRTTSSNSSKHTHL